MAGGEVRLEPVELTQRVPDWGGCLITGLLSGDSGPDAFFGVRLDPQDRIIGLVSERIHQPEPQHGDVRMAYSVWYGTPADAIFAPPEGPIYTYPPEP